MFDHLRNAIDSISTGNHSAAQLIDVVIFFQILSIVGFIITTFFLYQNVYGGLNCIFLGIILIVFTYLTHRVLRIEITRVSYGMILGGAGMMLFIMLQSAIFWSQYSGCVPYNASVPSNRYGVDCRYTGAMESLSTFSVFLFLSYIALIGIMMKYKDELLGNAPSREGGGYSTINSQTIPVASSVPYHAPNTMKPSPNYGYPTQHPFLAGNNASAANTSPFSR